jgi:hypothetical protein
MSRYSIVADFEINLQARLEYSQTLLANRQDELNISESKIRVATEIDILDKLISNQVSVQ